VLKGSIRVVKSVSKVVEAYGILVAKHVRIRSLGRAMTIGDDNIKIDPKYIHWEDVEWIRLVQNRVSLQRPL
jgi:hypothetical protein